MKSSLFRTIICWCILSLLPSLGQAEVLLSENFNSAAFPANWSRTPLQGAQDWTLQNSPTFSSTSAGYYMVFDDDALGVGTFPNEAVLTSPTLDLTNHGSIFVSFEHYWEGVEGTFGFVEVSSDGGATWSNAATFEKQTQGSLAAPSDTMLDISALAANSANVQVRFRYADSSLAGKFWYVDDVRVFSDPDVSMNSLQAPDFLDCGDLYGTAENVTVRVYNRGEFPIWDIPITCEVTGQSTTTINDLITDTIQAGNFVDFTLSSTVDMAFDTTYQFVCYTSLGTDQHLTNDTLITSRMQTTSSYPHKRNFNLSGDGWFPTGGNASNFFTHGSVPYLGGPEGKGDSWYMEKDGNTSYMDMFLYSPAFNFSSVTNPVINFDLKMALGGDWRDREIFFQYSIDDGANWNTLGNNTTPDWYNLLTANGRNNAWGDGTVADWTQVYHELCDLAGESCVKFRFFGNDMRNNDKFALDNFEIHDGPDVQVTEFVDPFDDGCLFSSTEPVTVRVYNRSCQSLSNVPVTVEVSGAANQVLTGTIPSLPPRSFTDFTFSQTVDMLPLGTYDFKGYTQLASDVFPENDTTTTQILVNLIKAENFPFTEEFDTSNGTWVATGGDAGNFLEWDTIPGSYLGGNEGQGASWYLEKNGTSTYQDFFLNSPVFNLCEMTNPKVVFDLKASLGGDWRDREIFFQYSLDGGSNWTTLGNHSDPNWTGTLPANGRNNAWGDGTIGSFTRMEHRLCIPSGETCVKFRFFMNDLRNNDQVAIDNFQIIDTQGDDVQPISIFPNESRNCGSFSASEPLGVVVQNNTCRPLENLPFTLNITGPNSATFTDTVPGPIARNGGRVQFDLPDSMDMSATGEYVLELVTEDNPAGTCLGFHNDTMPGNDTLIEVRRNTAPFQLPYVNTFEDTVGVFKEEAWANLQHHFKKGPLPAGYLGGPEGQGESWYLRRDGSGSYSDQFLETPPFDLSGTTNPILKFDLKMGLGGDWRDREVFFQYSTDGGNSWNTLGNNSTPDWYNEGLANGRSNAWGDGTIGSWQTMYHNLCDLAGEACVKFRWFANDTRNNDRFAIDNFEIRDSFPEVQVTRFLGPVDDGCLFNQNQTVEIELYNRSCQDAMDVPIVLNVAGTVDTTFLDTVPLIPNRGFTTHVVNGTFSMLNLGSFNFTAYTDAPTDPYPENDTAFNNVFVNSKKIVTFPHTEDFDTSNGFWVDQGGDATNFLVWDTIPGGYLGGNEGQGKSWYVQKDGSSSYMDFDLISPVFNMCELTNPIVEFDLKFSLGGDWRDREIFFQYSLDGGTSWTTIGDHNSPGNWTGLMPANGRNNAWGDGTIGNFTTMRHRLCIPSGETCVRFRLHMNDLRNNDQVAIDNFRIYDTQGDDLEPISIFPNESRNCVSFTDKEPLGVVVQNNTCRPMEHVPFQLQVNGPNNATFTDTIPGPIGRNGGRVQFDLPDSMDMSLAGEYVMELVLGDNPAGSCLSFHNDTMPGNDSLIEVRRNEMLSLPYTNTFEDTVGVFKEEAWANLQHHFKKDSLPYLNGPEGQGESWYLRRDGNSSYSDQFLETPAYDFSGFRNIVVFFDLKMGLGGDWRDREVFFQYSTDGGNSWNTLGNTSDPNWYDIAPANGRNNAWGDATVDSWTLVSHELCMLTNEPCVKFRWFANDTRNNDKFAIDNFRIFPDIVDVQTTAIRQPTFQGCLYGTDEQIEADFFNNSCDTLFDVPVAVQVSGPVNTTITGTVPVIPGGEAVSYTFPQTVDMTALGSYNFNVYADHPSDFERNNDTMSTALDVDFTTFDTYPHNTDFSGGSGNWVATGGDGANFWVNGPVPYLAGASGNGDSWYVEKDGSGTYMDFFLESSVYDFTNIQNPFVSFDMMFDLGGDWRDREVFFQYSTDGGANWNTLGTTADPDWYSLSPANGRNNAWGDGTIGDWTKMQHDMCFLTGQSCVKFRFFANDLRNNDKLAIDNFRISGTPLDVSPVAVNCCWGDQHPIEVTVRNIVRCLSTSPVNVRYGGTASASESFSSTPPADAFDADTIGSRWVNNGNLPVTLAYDYGAGNEKVINAYRIYSNTTSGSALGFSGVNNKYLDIADGGVPTGNTWTIEAHSNFPLEATGGLHALASYSANEHHIAVDGSGELGVYTGGTFWGSGYNTGSLGAGWHHIAAVGDAGNTEFYVDGTFVGTAARQVTLPIRRIGNSTAGNRNWGRVDEFRAWNTARTPAQISANQNNVLPDNTAGLNAYYHFEEGSGSTTADNATSVNYSGTLTNMAPNTDWGIGPFGASGLPSGLDHPDSWELQAWDGSAWITLHTVNGAGLSDNAPQVFNFSNSQPYARYRLRITASKNGGDTVNVTELQLMESFDLTIHDVNVHYNIDGNTGVQHFSGLNIAQNDEETVELTGLTVPNESSTITVWTSLPNFLPDDIIENDTITVPASNYPNCNDHCPNAIGLEFQTTTASQTSRATTDPDEDPLNTACSGITFENTVWYKFTTDAVGGELTADFFDQSCTPSNNGIQVSIMEVVTDSCDSTGRNEVFCANPSSLDTITWDTTGLPPNTQYFIAVDGFANNDCDFTIRLTGAAAVLPADVFQFRATQQPDQVLLNWEVESERAVDHYEVQRSPTGEPTSFREINRTGFIGGNGGSAAYQLPDKDPLKGRSYYRLRIVDIDGTKTYSKVESVFYGPEDQLSVYPNPLERGQPLTLALETTRDESLDLELVNALGQTVFTDSMDWNADETTRELPLGNLAFGSYRLVVRRGRTGEVSTHPVVIVR